MTKKIIAIITIVSLFTFSCKKENNKPDYKISGKYDVGGYELFLLSYGKDKPSVIIESGIGDAASETGWEMVQNEVKDFAQICLYDRAGLGKSDKGPEPRTTIQFANELHALLESAKMSPPYIMVGHSLGGLHIQTYAKLYPEDVAGMVFVDPTPKELVDTLSTEVLENLISMGVSSGTLSEAKTGLNKSIPTFKSLPTLPDVPVVVITSSFTGDIAKSQWEELKGYHQSLSDEVSDGTHIIATKSGHYIHAEEPKLVIDAIQSVYRKIK